MSEKLINLMKLSLDGDEKAIKDFYTLFKDSTFLIPNRFQSQKLSNSPQYPNDFFHLLGIQSKDKVFIPLFTKEEQIKEWSGNNLSFTSIAIDQLIEIIPKGWWLILHPGMEVEKEFSPWEINLLNDEQGIEEILEEINPDENLSEIEISEVDQDQKEFKDELIIISSKIKEINESYLLQEKGKNPLGEDEVSLLVALVLNTKSNKRAEEIKSTIFKTLSPKQIGGYKMKISYGNSLDSSITLKIFEKAIPVYKKNFIDKFKERFIF